MKKLIVHVGPGKCGSTSIQGFLGRLSQRLRGRIGYIHLHPANFRGVYREAPEEPVLKSFSDVLVGQFGKCDTLILSHEYLFDCPHAIKNICQVASALISDILVIGYARKQSDFMVSVYSQWLFRSRSRVKEVTDVVQGYGLNPALFDGLERHLIASVIDDFYSTRQLSNKIIHDWFESYHYLSSILSETGAIVKCRLLPNKNYSFSLIEDFCETSGLEITYDSSREIKNNNSFNGEIIEAINVAVALGLDMPGAHSRNKDIIALSELVGSESAGLSRIVLDMKDYIDGYYLKSNFMLCDEYGFDKNYFEAVRILSKSDVLGLIVEESSRRASDSSYVLNRYRSVLSNMSKVCFDLISEE